MHSMKCNSVEIYNFKELLKSFTALKEEDRHEHNVTRKTEAIAAKCTDPTMYSRMRDLQVCLTDEKTLEDCTMSSERRHVCLVHSLK